MDLGGMRILHLSRNTGHLRWFRHRPRCKHRHGSICKACLDSPHGTCVAMRHMQALYRIRSVGMFRPMSNLLGLWIHKA